MINATELRKGVIIEFEGKLYQVVEYQHVKMKKTALAKVKLRDINAGHTLERSFQSSERLVRARLDSRQMQYLYNDGGLYYFMDQENYEQQPFGAELLGPGSHAERLRGPVPGNRRVVGQFERPGARVAATRRPNSG